MKVSVGLFNNMVIQRDGVKCATVRFHGETGRVGCLVATVVHKSKTLGGLVKRVVGTAGRGRFEGVLRGLPVGGPYKIELSIVDEKNVILDTERISNVLVGDVWLLGGQSNMEGCGFLHHVRAPNDKVRAFYMDDHWDVARDPLHSRDKAKAEVHATINCGPMPPGKGAGLGVAFGQEMLHLSGGVPQGLIASAHGGTSMMQWDPGRKGEGTRSLYGAMLDRLRKNGGKVAGFVWYQGCSETCKEAAPLYTQRMVRFVKAVRRDFGDPKLPVTIVQLGRFTDAKPPEEILFWNSIREQQRLLPGRINHLLTVPAIDLDLDDAIHLCGADLITLGCRLAGAMASMTSRPPKPATPPIELDSVKTVKRGQELDMVVTLKNVVGSLRSAGRPTGFSIHEGGREIPSIFRTELEGPRVVLKTSLACFLPLLNKSLYYGFGLNPYVNIVDAAGRPLPAFGPIILTGMPPATCFFPDVEVSTPRAWPGGLDKVGYPKPVLPRFMPSVFQGFYCVPPGIAARKPGIDELHYFRFRFSCAKRMPVRLLFGYDGPVKVFIDGQALFADPAGINPITIDEAKVDFIASQGRHEVVIALGTNGGKAWGICVRLDRSDLAGSNPRMPPVSPVIEKLGKSVK